MANIVKKYKYTAVCTGALMLLSLFGCLMVMVRKSVTGKYGFLFLIWNLFLAWIPFGVSILMTYIYSSKAPGRKLTMLMPLGVLWLLFYPNAPYMLTDFIHFRNNNSFLIWYDLVIYSVFIWTGFLLGFISLYTVNRIVEGLTNKFIGWAFVLFSLFLSSFGIYIGRFIRWNSWDILLNPLGLLRSILENIHYQSFVFSLIYGSMMTLIYVFLYGLTHLKLDKVN